MAFVGHECLKQTGLFLFFKLYMMVSIFIWRCDYSLIFLITVGLTYFLSLYCILAGFMNLVLCVVRIMCSPALSLSVASI